MEEANKAVEVTPYLYFLGLAHVMCISLVCYLPKHALLLAYCYVFKTFLAIEDVQLSDQCQNHNCFASQHTGKLDSVGKTHQLSP